MASTPQKTLQKALTALLRAEKAAMVLPPTPEVEKLLESLRIALRWIETIKRAL
jgi:hypothetical protein